MNGFFFLVYKVFTGKYEFNLQKYLFITMLLYSLVQVFKVLNILKRIYMSRYILYYCILFDFDKSLNNIQKSLNLLNLLDLLVIITGYRYT